MIFSGKATKPWLALIFVSAMTLALAACEDEGPAEEIGEQLDQVTTDAGNAIEDACESVKEGANAEDTDC